MGFVRVGLSGRAFCLSVFLLDLHHMELQVGVKVLLKNPEGKYLLIRRSSEKYPEVGAKWDIVGGRIDPGSTLLENLKREISEEVNLDLQDEPRLIAAQDILRVAGRHVVRLTYVSSIKGEPRITDSDHSEWKWFTLQEIKNLNEKDLDSFFIELLDKGLFD